jgi:hypothetical protein
VALAGCERNPFIGSLLTLDPAAALQYYQTAMIILRLGEPTSQAQTALHTMMQISALTQDLENRATQVCALAVWSQSPSVWINAFGPIAFCRNLFSGRLFITSYF